MKYKINFLTVWGFFISLMFLCSACGDNIVGIDDRGNNTIVGKIVDTYGNPISGAAVEIVNVSFPNKTYSRADGTFILDSVKIPYDIAGLLHDSGSINDRNASIYLGATTLNPVLTLGRNCTAYSSGLITINLLDTNSNPNHKFAFIFWDSLGINQIFTEFYGTNPIQMNKFWFTEGNLEGKAAIIGYYISNGQISSYDKYGEKSLTIKRNENINITFTKEEIQTDPDEIQIELKFIQTPGLTVNKFAGLSKSEFYNFENAGIPLPISLQSTSNIIKLPSIPGNNFYSFVNLYCMRQSGGANGSISYRVYNGASYGPPNIPDFNYPPDGASGIDPYTQFSISTDNNNGIIEFTRIRYITAENPCILRVYTSKTNVVFPKLSDDFFNLKRNTQYDWRICQFGGINSTDKILSQAININPNIKQVGNIANDRTFNTGNW